jgi:gamma-glutamyltranspeptidase/glutathione hydrolase
MVAASQPLAAQSGLRMLQAGGNAVDAAIAAAAALTVVEPTGTGIGGDAFALVWYQGKLYGLNASGPSPASISLDAVMTAGMRELGPYGPLAVTVPGAPAGWAMLAERFGKLPLATLLADAVELARDGFAVSPMVAYAWQQAYANFKTTLHGKHFQPWFDAYAPAGRAPRAGEVWRLPAQARTLEAIGADGGQSFYRGSLARRIAECVCSAGGYLSESDLAGYAPRWVEPMSTAYRGYDVWELPPNGQGVIALLALKILQGFDFAERDTLLTLHRQIEAMKLAFEAGLAHVADPAHMRIGLTELLSDEFAARLRERIGTQAFLPEDGRRLPGGTVYLSTADADGNMVSFIQSNYMDFGSAMVVPGTGINLQNRGHSFSLDRSHPNCLAPGKLPYHTIIPGFLTRQGRAVGPFGVMGAYMQPQGHVQMVMNAVDFGLNPQASLDAPRWEWVQGKSVNIERAMPEHLFRGLAAQGHDLAWSNNPLAFGRGQIIWRSEDGVLTGGTEPRADGHIAAW